MRSLARSVHFVPVGNFEDVKILWASEELARGREKAARLEGEAYRRGYAAGREEGFAASRQSFRAADAESRALKARMIDDVRQASSRIARSIIARELTLEPGVIEELCMPVLTRLESGPEVLISVPKKFRGTIEEILRSQNRRAGVSVTDDASIIRISVPEGSIEIDPGAHIDILSAILCLNDEV